MIKADDAAGAEAQLLIYAPQLSAEARAEAGQRVAFVYYVLGLDLDARRVADTWRQGATGEWAAQAAWVSGLASWRLGDCNSASRDFPAGRASSRSSASFAPARSIGPRAPSRRAGRPASVEPLAAAPRQHVEPGKLLRLVARETLGMDTQARRPIPIAGFDPPDRPASQRPARDGAGEDRRAGARRGNAPPPGQDRPPTEHHALIQLAKKLDLPGRAAVARQ